MASHNVDVHILSLLYLAINVLFMSNTSLKIAIKVQTMTEVCYTLDIINCTIYY